MIKEVFLDCYDDYDSTRDKDEPITCKFKLIYLPEDGEVRDAVKESINWMATENSPRFTINNTNTEFELIITGRGNDFRCGSCRQFRTRLRNILKEKDIKLIQPKCCRFDKEEGYGIDFLEELKRKIKLYEEGLDEESSEEDYERWVKRVKELEGR